MISRQATIDMRRYTFGNDEFNLENAYHDCKLVFDGITDDDSFQKADTGLILYYANEIIYALHKALESKGINILNNDCINRRGAIDALWKSLYEYEDKTEKQFLESKELDVADWFKHRIFVQNMSDIDRQTILNLPPAQPDYQEVLGWLLAYHTKSFALHGRYIPHEVISWLINDFTKDLIAERRVGE